KATVAVRPSRLVLQGKDGVAAQIVKATYVGVRMEYTLEGIFGRVFAVHDDVDNPLEIGTNVKMSFAKKGPVLLPRQ
ncbi:MAG: TOBE domain-containing protein, partial [Pseudomonadota bacterium]